MQILVYIVCPYRWDFSKAIFGYMYSLYVIFCQRQNKFEWNIYVIWNKCLVSNKTIHDIIICIRIQMAYCHWISCFIELFSKLLYFKEIQKKANMSCCWFECEIGWNKCLKTYFKSDFVVISYNLEWNTTAKPSLIGIRLYENNTAHMYLWSCQA